MLRDLGSEPRLLRREGRLSVPTTSGVLLGAEWREHHLAASKEVRMNNGLRSYS